MFLIQRSGWVGALAAHMSVVLHFPQCVPPAAAAAVDCRDPDGRFPFALLRRNGKEQTFHPKKQLIKKIKSCNQSLSEQELQDFLASIVIDMRLVPRTDEAKALDPFPDGIFKDNAPFTYE
jgi:cellulase/cellobiase CelA1